MDSPAEPALRGSCSAAKAQRRLVAKRQEWSSAINVAMTEMRTKLPLVECLLG